MKRWLLLFAFAAAALAAGIDGKWVADFKIPAGKKGGEARAVQATLNLKSQGNQLTGTVTMPGRRGDQNLNVENGKIDGNNFSFVTVQKTRKGENKTEWKGTVEGDQLKGTRGREGARRGMPFTAKKQ
ncbi:MAG: hypothetical protein ACE15B_14935 [Bryobacteraceae bacterium]